MFEQGCFLQDTLVTYYATLNQVWADEVGPFRSHFKIDQW